MSWQSGEPPDLIGPILKGLQVRSYLEDIKARREERAIRAETHRMNIEAHQQDQALKRFKIQRDLQDAGFLPAAAGDTGQNDEVIAAAVNITPENRRPLLEAPGIGRFRAPSQSDRFKRAAVLAQQKGQLDAAEQEAKDPSVEIAIPEKLGGGTQKVPSSKRLDYWLKIQDAIQKQRPDLKVSYADDATGKRTFFGYDPATESIKILKEFKGVAKPQVERTAGGLTPHQQFQQEHTLKQESRAEQKEVDDAIGDAQKAIDAATQDDEKFEMDQRPDPKSSPKWKAARIAAERAAKRFPWAVQATVDDNGYPGVKDIRGEPWAPPKPEQRATAPTGTTATSPRAVSPSTAAASITRRQYLQAVKDLGKAAADAEVKRRKLTIIED